MGNDPVMIEDRTAALTEAPTTDPIGDRIADPTEAPTTDLIGDQIADLTEAPTTGLIGDRIAALTDIPTPGLMVAMTEITKTVPIVFLVPRPAKKMMNAPMV